MNVARNIAVVGCGYWGQNLVRTMAGIGALHAVSDADLARAQGFAAQYGVKALSFDEVLADDTVTGIVLAVPAPLHADMGMRALRAGKHVLVEKPIALSLADAQAMVDAAAQADRVLMVGHLLQYHPAFLALKALADDGILGPLRHIHSTRLNFGKVRMEENVFWSFAPHDVSMMLALAGRAPVKAAATAFKGIAENPVASTVIATLDFGGGLHGHIHVSWFNPFKEQKLVVAGDKGMAVFDDTQGWDKKLALYRHRVTFADGQPVLHKADAEYIALEAAEPLREECLHFIACMDNGAAPRTDGAEGLRVLDVLQQCGGAA